MRWPLGRRRESKTPRRETVVLRPPNVPNEERRVRELRRLVDENERRALEALYPRRARDRAHDDEDSR